MSGERRPIATRELGISRRIAARLAALGCTPNSISTAGMVAGVLAGAAFYATAQLPDLARLWFGCGAVLVQLRLLANMFDGMVAVENDQTSPVGELYNEVPDRVSDVAILVGLGYAVGGLPTLGWAAAVIAVTTAYVRAQVAVAGGPQDFCGPMAKPQRMFLVTVIALYCTAAPASMQPTLNSGAGLPAAALAVVAVLGLITAWRRLQRGAHALRSRA